MNKNKIKTQRKLNFIKKINNKINSLKNGCYGIDYETIRLQTQKKELEERIKENLSYIKYLEDRIRQLTFIN